MEIKQSNVIKSKDIIFHNDKTRPHMSFTIIYKKNVEIYDITLMKPPYEWSMCKQTIKNSQWFFFQRQKLHK